MDPFGPKNLKQDFIQKQSGYIAFNLDGTLISCKRLEYFYEWFSEKLQINGKKTQMNKRRNKETEKLKSAQTRKCIEGI